MVCPEWRDNSSAFMEWAFANGYADNLEIDRIDNDNGYSPENCRWATRQQQTNNQQRCRMITKDGRTQSASDWGRELGIDPETIYRRAKVGWPEERLLDDPRKYHKR